MTEDHCSCQCRAEVRRIDSVDPTEGRSGSRRKRRRRRSGQKYAIRKWAKDDVPEGDVQDEINVGLVVALAVGLLLILLVTYIAGQMEYEAPF